MERTILHCDGNNYYASVECAYHPEFRGKPIAVVGDPEQRHGIVLAKSYEAKKCGVQTGNPLWMAKQVCPDILFVPPHYDLYFQFSQICRNIYSEYTDRVEPYGLDECWLDVTGRDGKTVADTLRQRIKSELGITISVGVSYNKIFAKLGSDMKKPDATTVIPREQFQEIVWPLPVSDLLFVGHSTTRVFQRKYIHTIGDLANQPRANVKGWLGKCGEGLWLYANGYDSSPVARIGDHQPIKSIGNSTTMPRDLYDLDEIKVTLMVLSESVAARLRQNNLQCETVQVSVRDADLTWIERQGKLVSPCCESGGIYHKALELLQANHKEGNPIRSLGVRGCNLIPRQYEQISFSPDIIRMQRNERIEDTLDGLRGRFGNKIVRRGMVLTDHALAALDPQTDHPNLVLSNVHNQR